MDHSAPMDTYSNYRKPPHQELQSLGILEFPDSAWPERKTTGPQIESHRWNHAIRHKHKGHFYDCCAQPGPDTTWTAWTSILHVCQMCHFFTSNFAGQKWSQTEQMYLRNTGNTSLWKRRYLWWFFWELGHQNEGGLWSVESKRDSFLSSFLKLMPFGSSVPSEIFWNVWASQKIHQKSFKDSFCWTKHTDRSRIGIPKMVDLCWFYISSLSPRMKHIYRYIYISFHLPP